MRVPGTRRGTQLAEETVAKTESMSSQDMVRMNREYTLFSWLIQSRTAPIGSPTRPAEWTSCSRPTSPTSGSRVVAGTTCRPCSATVPATSKPRS